MRVAVWPADSAGCGHYRLRFPAAALQRQGADVVVDSVGPSIVWNAPWTHHPGPQHRVLGLHKPYEADVVVLQRPGRRWWADLIPFLQAQGTRVVVDVDDLFDGVDRRNIAWAQYRGDVVHHRWVDEACRLADTVTVTTPALLERYGHGHGVVLPNLVPETYLNVYGLKMPHTVGWSGFVETHPGDLRVPGGAVAQVVESAGWSFHVIGTGNGVQNDLRMSRPVTASGQVDFADYAFHLARLELGVVPLADTLFNRAKSSLKAAEMAALGVPVVMTPTADNRRLHKAGVGVLAESRSQWRRQLERLVTDAGARYELAERGRESIRAQTYERHADRWATAWGLQGERQAAA